MNPTMATTRTEAEFPSVDRATAKQVETGSFTESMGGAGALILGILGLIGVLPAVLGPIATISAGLALLAGGAVIAARAVNLAGRAKGSDVRRQIMSGLGMEGLAGGAAAVLGLLALLQISTVTLMSVAAIVLGAALLMASGATSRLETLISSRAKEAGHELSHQAVYVATGSDFIVGAGAIVLGVLALTGYNPLTLSLVAVLAVGASTLLSGSTLAVRFLALFG